MDRDQRVEELLEMEYWLLDVLPEQVPAEKGDAWFAVEEQLQSGHRNEFTDRFVRVLLRMLCYWKADAWCGEWYEGSPERVEALVRRLMEAQARTLDLYFPEEDALLLLNGDDLYMTVYHPSADMLSKMEALASSEGLFWRQNK